MHPGPRTYCTTAQIHRIPFMEPHRLKHEPTTHIASITFMAQQRLLTKRCTTLRNVVDSHMYMSMYVCTYTYIDVDIHIVAHVATNTHVQQHCYCSTYNASHLLHRADCTEEMSPCNGHTAQALLHELERSTRRVHCIHCTTCIHMCLYSE